MSITEVNLPFRLSPFEEVLADCRQGKPIIMVDDEGRENEGDLIVATEKLTPEIVTFMAQHGRGLICVSISGEKAEELHLPFQTLNNNSPYQTPFAVSIDHVEAVMSGVTSSARAKTMCALIDSKSKPEDFVSPGHVFPLVAHPAGVIGRQGQTEGSYDLARLAGCAPSGVLCEILNTDGTVAKGQEIGEFAERFKLKITSVAEVLKYRVSEEILIREVACSELRTEQGKFKTKVFVDDVDNKEHLALVYGEPDRESGKGVHVRIHSECLTGDVFGSRRCDCGLQLSEAMQEIVKAGEGVVIYLRQEGRGIGLANKVKAYALQDQGRDTVQANIELGFEPDLRDFAVAAKILHELKIRRVRLMTNNPRKIDTLQKLGVEVAGRVSLEVPVDEYSKNYLETKRSKLGHLLGSSNV